METIFLIYASFFSLKSLLSDIAYVKSIKGFSVDVLVTKIIRSFHHTAAFESDLSDCPKLILTFFRA